MATLRDYIARTRSTHKLISGDNLITDRAIAAELKGNGLLLIKRETDKGKLWSTDSAFEDIGCLRLNPVPLSECCDAPNGMMVARSKFKLPKIAEGNLGHLIQGVYNATTNKKLKEVSINRYLNLLKLSTLKKENYFFILNGYLYVTNPDIVAVRIRAHFEETIPDEIRYPVDCDICGSKAVNDCLNPLDRPFAFPGYLESQLITITSQGLLATYFKIPDDKSSDNKDDQVAIT